MIIISQDKNGILNFDNIQLCRINQEGIVYVFLNEYNSFKLGEYSTEERAKEVLQQIACRYSSEEIYKRANSKTQEELTRNYVEIKIIPYIFEMPER